NNFHRHETARRTSESARPYARRAWSARYRASLPPQPRHQKTTHKNRPCGRIINNPHIAPSRPNTAPSSASPRRRAPPAHLKIKVKSLRGPSYPKGLTLVLTHGKG